MGRRTIQVGVVLLVVASAILVLSFVDGPLSPDKVGTGGQWFAGLVGALVLAWALGEPERRRLEARGTQVEHAAVRGTR